MASIEGKKESTLNLKTITNELGSASVKCTAIGVQLGIPRHELKKCEKESDPLSAAVDYWLKGNKTDPEIPVSWESIVMVLQSDAVGEGGLAKKIEDKYCHNSEGSECERAFHHRLGRKRSLPASVIEQPVPKKAAIGSHHQLVRKRPASASVIKLPEAKKAATDPSIENDKATVLLVGSTGNGKSALGNFLLDPTNEEKLTKQDKQYFTTATDLQPHTKTTVVKSELVSYKSHSGTLTVVDTPGLNDVKDFENMILLMKKLEDLKEIHTCIVVVKSEGKIDDQYKETMKYYFKLLPDLFKKNLFVVVTHLFQDKASKQRREKTGIGEEVIKRDTLNALQKMCDLPANPLLFMIDSVPSEDDTVSKTVRDEILEYVFGQEPTIPQFHVAKPRSIMQHDKTKYDSLVQKATKDSLQTYSNNPTLQHERDSMDNDISSIKAEIRHFELKRDELDTEELVEHVTWSTRKKHKWFGVPSARFDLSTHPYKIRNIKKGGSRDHWREERQTEYTYSGKVVGESFHGFKANIELQIYKKDKNANEISSLTQKIQERESHLSKKMQERAKLIARHEQIFKENSEDLIKKARKHYQHYLDEYMTPDEAIQRLQEIKSSS